VYGNGGLLTTVDDLIVWWDALHKNKLGDGFLAQLTTSGVLNSKHQISYALGVSNGTYRGVREITHSGATAGYRAYLANYPESQTTVAVLCNDGSANSGAHVQAVTDVVLAGQLAPVAPAPAIKAAENVNVGPLAGLYLDRNTGDTYRLEARAGRLVGGPVDLIPIAPDKFQMAGRDVEVNVFRNSGTTELHVPGRDLPITQLIKVTEAKPDAARLAEYAGTYTSPELGVVFQVSAGDGNLVVKRRLQSDLTLVPTYADAFSNFGNWTFTRDASGTVNGLLYSQGRVRRVRFEKQRGS
jgi:hypothetical protein